MPGGIKVLLNMFPLPRKFATLYLLCRQDGSIVTQVDGFSGGRGKLNPFHLIGWKTVVSCDVMPLTHKPFLRGKCVNRQRFQQKLRQEVASTSAWHK